MRAVSISSTFSCANSPRRIPVAYRVSSQIRCSELSAESINRWTSSRLRTSGKRIGRFGIGGVLDAQVPFQRLVVEEAGTRKVLRDSVGVQFFVGQQMGLVLPDLFRA
jgi:hypothetical protein